MIPNIDSPLTINNQIHLFIQWEKCSYQGDKSIVGGQCQQINANKHFYQYSIYEWMHSSFGVSGKVSLISRKLMSISKTLVYNFCHLKSSWKYNYLQGMHNTNLKQQLQFFYHFIVIFSEGGWGAGKEFKKIYIINFLQIKMFQKPFELKFH